ncbi:MAG: 23S rRNA (adenine(2503)-C(2))-methyltransferase RlmN, partial [Planctomycetota bacterium]
MATLARDLGPDELKQSVLELGGKPLHARLFASWVLERGLESFDQASDLPLELRRLLAERFSLEAATIAERVEDRDGTRKLLLGLRDGETIEMVMIPEGERNTLCVSSQVGCPVGCIFCASGLFGVRRNLGCAEIVEQFLLARGELGDRPLTNLVVMGLGEPMLNLANLLPALGMISNPRGLAFSPRRITVSTSGFPERIRELARSGRGYELAVSLHAADPDLRRKLVPTSTEDPEALVLAAMDYRRVTGREPSFEVVLLAGLNDGPEHARGLGRLL